MPICHALSADQVRAHSPSLADEVALSTAETSIDEMAKQIAAVVKGESDAEVA